METATACPSGIGSSADRKGTGLIIYASAYVFLILLFQKIYPLTSFYNRTASLWIQMTTYCVLGIGGILLFKDLFKEGLTRWKTHPVKSIIWLIAAYFGDLILSNLAALPQAMLFPDYSSVNQNNIENALQLAPGFMIILSFGILGPVTEEMIFRFTLVERAKSRFPAAVCVILSSLLFMLIHVHALNLPDFLSNLPLLVSGVIFAVCMLRSKNPTLPVLLHIMNNAPVFLLMYRKN